MSVATEAVAGSVVADRYVLEERIGAGGMGEVWAAEDRVLGREVAVKLLRAMDALGQNGAERSARLLREARAAAAIDSPFVARVFDADVSGAVPFIAMERLHGHSLQHEIEERRQLPVGEACGLVMQACAGMAAAHALGVVHRDIKPSNLFLVERGSSPRLKVLDFGIAKTERAALDGLTETGRALGTPGYLAPEQLRHARHTDARVDVWALGLVLFQLLSGRRAFDAADDVEYAAMILTEAPTPLRSLLPTVPETLADTVHRCLRRDPAQRWDSVATFAQALAQFADDGDRLVLEVTRVGRTASPPTPGTDEAMLASRVPATPTTLAGNPSLPTPTTETPPLTTSSRRWLGAALLASALLGSSLWWTRPSATTTLEKRSSSPSPPPRAPSPSLDLSAPTNNEPPRTSAPMPSAAPPTVEHPPRATAAPVAPAVTTTPTASVDPTTKTSPHPERGIWEPDL